MWGTVSPFDPTTFYVINEWAADALAGRLDGRYTPLEVADWISGFVAEADEHVKILRSAPEPDPQLRRTAVDAVILSYLGSFFAARFRSAADYAIYQQTGDRTRLESALVANREARDAWIELIDASEGIYQSNLRFGPERNEHGNWADRLTAIEADVDAMARELKACADEPGRPARVAVPDRPASTGLQHQPPESYEPGDDVMLSVAPAANVTGVRLRYRHVNQAEHWETVDLEARSGQLVGTIPGDYTKSTYPLMYFFVVEHDNGAVALHPGFEADLANQPYYLIMPS
ncbi:hypothetical protein GCM10027613_21380 [Microlunatus endophyticus]